LRAPPSAHRLDEYLQATIFSVEKDGIQASMRLVPGIAVSSAIMGVAEFTDQPYLRR
jgi:hypothetical protein